MAAIEAIAVWIDVSAVGFQAQPVQAQRPSELDHQTIITTLGGVHADVSVDAAGAPQPFAGR
jgi:hypothetical protein